MGDDYKQEHNDDRKHPESQAEVKGSVAESQLGVDPSTPGEGSAGKEKAQKEQQPGEGNQEDEGFDAGGGGATEAATDRTVVQVAGGFTSSYEGDAQRLLDVNVGQDLPWLNFAVFKIMDLTRAVILTMAFVQNVTLYWAGTLKWTFTSLQSPRTDSSSTSLQSPRTESSSFAMAWVLNYTNELSTLLTVVLVIPMWIEYFFKMRKGGVGYVAKKMHVYHIFEKLLVRIHGGRPPYLPIPASFQLFQNLAQPIGFVVWPNVLSRWIVPAIVAAIVNRPLNYAETSCSVLMGQIYVMSACYASAFGICGTRNLAALDAIVGNIPCPPPKFHGIKIISFSLAACGPTYGFRDSEAGPRIWLHGNLEGIHPGIWNAVVSMSKTGDPRATLHFPTYAVFAILLTWTVASPAAWITLGVFYILSYPVLFSIKIMFVARQKEFDKIIATLDLPAPHEEVSV